MKEILALHQALAQARAIAIVCPYVVKAAAPGAKLLRRCQYMQCLGDATCTNTDMMKMMMIVSIF